MKNLILMLMCMTLYVSCQSTGSEPKERKKIPFMWEGNQENAESTESGFSWDVDAPARQSYVLTFSGVNRGTEEVLIKIKTDQGQMSRITLPPWGEVKSFFIENFFLNAGVQTLSLSGLGEKVEFVKLTISHKVPIKTGALDLIPVDPNASPEVIQLMAFLGENYGKHILSGQQDLTWDDRVDMEERVRSFTSYTPALMGYDLMNYKGKRDRGSGLTQIEEALKFAEKGGLITFCWHWRMGEEAEFYTKKTDFRINQDPNSEEYKQIIADIDAAAKLLMPLKANNVPVLWRPLHEASGGWFWWGATGREDYLFLWNLLQDRMMNYHGLNNLIWVWNAQDFTWYPGDDRVDIIGMDIYEGKGDHKPQADDFARAQNAVNGEKLKLIAITENGSIPDPALLQEEGIPWSWFMTWNDNNSNDEEDFFSGPLYTSHKNKRLFYHHPYVLNLEDISIK